MKQDGNTYHAVFSSELLVCEILSRLPLESLQTCKCVCRSWQSIIQKNPCFNNLHANRSRLNHNARGLLFLIGSRRERNHQLFYGEFEEIRRRGMDASFSYKTLAKIDHPFINKRKYGRPNIIGSCNGLVCFFLPHFSVDDPVYICNPITREYANLPRISYKRGLVVSGFGYHPPNNKYKVVRIHYLSSIRDKVTRGFVQVYTLGSGTGWRDVGEITYTLLRPGILANGSLYWFDKKQSKIVVFDLGDEEFGLLPTVPQCCFHGSKHANYEVTELGGYLCLLHMELGTRVDIWSYKLRQMKQVGSHNHDNTAEAFQSWSWSLDFSIACPSDSYKYGDIFMPDLYVPFALTDNNEVLLWLNETSLLSYDKETDTLRTVVGEDTSLNPCQGIPHTNSLVSLKAFGEKSKTRKYNMREIKTKKKTSEQGKKDGLIGEEEKRKLINNLVLLGRSVYHKMSNWRKKIFTLVTSLKLHPACCLSGTSTF